MKVEYIPFRCDPCLGEGCDECDQKGFVYEMRFEAPPSFKLEIVNDTPIRRLTYYGFRVL